LPVKKNDRRGNKTNPLLSDTKNNCPLIKVTHEVSLKAMNSHEGEVVRDLDGWAQLRESFSLFVVMESGICVMILLQLPSPSRFFGGRRRGRGASAVVIHPWIYQMPILPRHSPALVEISHPLYDHDKGAV
jgi:hypothetical protein